MNLFPTTHENFIAWSKSIASDMQSSSNGKTCIKYNKLAAIMARTLPNTNADFNINTLKSLLSDSETVKSPTLQTSSQTDLKRFLDMIKVDMTHCVFEYAQEIVNSLKKGSYKVSTLYDDLNSNDEIGEIYADFYELDEKYHALASKLLPEIDQQRLDDAFRDNVATMQDFHKKSYSYVQSMTVGFAYREFLKDTLYCFFDELSTEYENSDKAKAMDDLELKYWIKDAFENWEGDETFKSNEKSIEPTKEDALIQKVGQMFNVGFTEQGNHAFTTESLESTVIFKKIDDKNYIQIAFNASNYPAFDIGVVAMTDDALKAHIKEHLYGWNCLKCQFDDIRLSDRCVIGDDDEE